MPGEATTKQTLCICQGLLVHAIAFGGETFRLALAVERVSRAPPKPESLVSPVCNEASKWHGASWRILCHAKLGRSVDVGDGVRTTG